MRPKGWGSANFFCLDLIELGVQPLCQHMATPLFAMSPAEIPRPVGRQSSILVFGQAAGFPVIRRMLPERFEKTATLPLAQEMPISSNQGRREKNNVGS
jgi:hypothetical protein